MRTTELFRLDGQVAIGTGGAGYFGKPISMALADAGAHVIITSREIARSDAQAERIRANGGTAEGLALDQASDDSIREGMERIKARHGRVDILVNNAVTREGMGDLEDLTRAGLAGEMSVNIAGLFMLTQAVVELMKTAGSGSIINIGSIQGTVGPHFPVYGDTGMSSPLNYTFEKWGMVGFTKWLANYYGRFGIRANCVSPGGYGPGVAETPGREPFIENYRRLTPLGRFAEDDDIKGPVVFLASAAAAYVTGHNLLVDGGWTSW